MTRDLTSDEIRLVNINAKPDGSRPMVYDSSLGEYNEIGRDVEVFLILAPLEWRNEVSNFLRILADNDLSDRGALNDLRDKWMNEEFSDVTESIDGYSSIFDSYDSIKAGLDTSIIGFESVQELNSLSSSINSGLVGLVEARDSLNFVKSALSALKIRFGSNTTRDDLRLELLSWSQALIAY